ncbi:hypothetical protein XI03_35105 [Bradyrhizobium sp. CCBAU 65884]|nr:hypothetical protein [Bradyrhizobium sp. CCBAU 65884]
MLMQARSVNCLDSQLQRSNRRAELTGQGLAVERQLWMRMRKFIEPQDQLAMPFESALAGTSIALEDQQMVQCIHQFIPKRFRNRCKFPMMHRRTRQSQRASNDML